MSDPLLDRQVRPRPTVLRHAEEVTGNMAMTCRYFGISRQLYYTWLRRYRAKGSDGVRDCSRRPKTSPGATRTEIVKATQGPSGLSVAHSGSSLARDEEHRGGLAQ